MTIDRKSRAREILRRLAKAALVKLFGDDVGSMLFEQVKGVGVSALLAVLLVLSMALSIFWLPTLYQKAVALFEMFPREVAVTFITPPKTQPTKEFLSVRVQVVNKSTKVSLPVAPNQVGIFQEPAEELDFDQSSLHLDSEEFKATSLEPSEYQVFAKFTGSSKFKPARSSTFKFILYDQPDVQEAAAWRKTFPDSVDISSRGQWFMMHPKAGHNLSQVIQITPQQDTAIKDAPFIWCPRPVKFPCEVSFTMRPLVAGAQLAVSLDDHVIFLIDTESQFRLSAWERDFNSSTGLIKRLKLESDGQSQESVPLPIDIRSAEERYIPVEMRLSKSANARYTLTVTMLGVGPGKLATTEVSFGLTEPLPQKGVVGFGGSRMSRGVEIGDLHLYAVRETSQPTGNEQIVP